MKKIILIVALLMPSFAIAVPDTWIEVFDGAGVLVGHVTEVKVGGQGHNTPSTGWVRGLSTAVDPATGGELGTFRFVADMMMVTHHNRVYFTGAGCAAGGGPIYFVVEDDPAPADTMNAEGRAGIWMNAEWATAPLPAGPLPPAAAYMDPFGPCLPNPAGVLPGAASQYRMGAGITRAYAPPFGVM